MPTLLHLSDLHRTSDPHLKNDELLPALIGDAQRWEEEGIPSPDFVVVSGDLIQGASLSDSDPDSKIASQYSEAHDFLVEIAKNFVESDHSRVIIVPGNHDVHWGKAKDSMRPFDICPPDIGRKRLRADSEVRWDWGRQQAYEIVDRGLYETRFNAFRHFRAEFYKDVNPSPISQGDTDLVFFEYPELDIAVVGFASWYGNDCFCHVGDIAPASLANSQQLLLNSEASVAVAVWHHSIWGGPQADDYMNQNIIHRLIDFGFSVGLHGHQHYPDAAPYEVNLPNLTSMAVVCAGSLAVGDRELPMGEARQFNLVEIDIENRSITVHVRAMSPAGVFFGSHREEFGGNTFMKLRLSLSSARRSRVTSTHILDEAFAAIGARDFEKALRIAETISPDHSVEKRQIEIEALKGLGCSETLVELIALPTNVDEVFLGISLLLELERFDEAEEWLSDESALLDSSHRAD